MFPYSMPSDKKTIFSILKCFLSYWHPIISLVLHYLAEILFKQAEYFKLKPRAAVNWKFLKYKQIGLF